MMQGHFSSWDLPIDPIFVTSAIEVLLDLSMIKQHLLITDLNMSGIDGFELIKKLQAHPQFSGLPILVVTGLSIQEIEDRGGVP